MPAVEPTPDGTPGIQLSTVLRFIDIAVDALAGAREEIDALNVYPVPDGDTGTNLYLTMAAARDGGPRACHRASPSELAGPGWNNPGRASSSAGSAAPAGKRW